jgi:predicted transcriptional regulator
MKRAVNVRLEENIVLILEKLSQEMHTTKTDVIEKAIKLFSNQNNKKKNELLEFAGILEANEADRILEKIKADTTMKDFTVDL